MEKRSVVGVVLLPFVTFGIYALYWLVKTKGELNSRGAEIPTAWLIIVPIANIYWTWKYFEGAEKVTGSKVNGVLMFVLYLVGFSIVSMALCQDAYNNLQVADVSAPVTQPPVAPQPPAPSV